MIYCKCIICASTSLGTEYLNNLVMARGHIKKMEKALLALSKKDLPEESKKNYDKAHKRLVKLRKQIQEVEYIRCGIHPKTKAVKTEEG